MLNKLIVKYLPYQDRIHYHTSYALRKFTAYIAIISLLTVFYYDWVSITALWPKVFITMFGVLTVAMLLLERCSFTPFFLLSTFMGITSFRLSALAGWRISKYLFALMVILAIVNFCVAAYKDYQENQKHFPGQHHSGYEWQLMFIRLYLGYDLVPHFSEKLFAGSLIRGEDVTAFTALGVHYALLMVILSGLIEFLASLAISCGLFTRLAAICLFIYLMVSTVLGHHFSHGFIWANQGGGWEYPLLWSVLILSFAVFGAGKFSIDEVLKEHLRFPNWLKALMGYRSRNFIPQSS